ncbi:MAG TPA: hypothetical protein VKX28_05010 [Xanthobacteraceae bacterium]|jgi:hypothetical protein|nr:hypothetical protein [Xanthobacteraceae bacterium]
MAKAVETAIEALRSLPERDQERMGRQLLSHIEKLLALRLEVDKGSRALDEAAGDVLDVEEFLSRQNERHQNERHQNERHQNERHGRG